MKNQYRPVGLVWFYHLLTPAGFTGLGPVGFGKGWIFEIWHSKREHLLKQQFLVSSLAWGQYVRPHVTKHFEYSTCYNQLVIINFSLPALQKICRDFSSIHTFLSHRINEASSACIICPSNSILRASITLKYIELVLQNSKYIRRFSKMCYWIPETMTAFCVSESPSWDTHVCCVFKD